MGILNTRFAIVLPLIGLFMPFAVFWMRAHFVNMPSEISEAARVDGASTWDLFWRIHVPLARAPIASLGILMSVWAWNQFLLALVLVEDPTQRTMAGALGAFQGHYATDIPLLSAGTILILAADADRLHHLPAPGHRGAAPGFGEGMTGRVTATSGAWRPDALARRIGRASRRRSPTAAPDLPGLAGRRPAGARRAARRAAGRRCSAASTSCRRSRRPAIAASRR